MNKYPEVLGEFQTMRRVVAGASLARYGDGEIKMAQRVVGIKSQVADERLTARLASILTTSGDCLVGIPNIHAVIREHVSDQKVEHWAKYLASRSILADRPYVSSFVTRPDSAPWINTPDYWAMVESLWRGQDVTLVRGSSKSLVADDLSSAASVREIIAPRQHAWAEYHQLLERIGAPTRAIICLGPTATVMAVDLCAKGVHAIDFGHGGMFRRKYLRGLPMVVSEDEKAVDRVPA